VTQNGVMMEKYSNYIDRQPVAAGRFYSAHAEKLEEEISNMIKEARASVHSGSPKTDRLQALIAPHAGYVFSGVVSASAFMLLKGSKPRKRVFLIGSSHHTDFNGASIYNVGDYLTPFGKVNVDTELSTELIQQSSIFEFVQAAHAHEHGLEVMLPFIQYFWKNEFSIIPIIIATHRTDVCKKIAHELLPWFNLDNLFIVSTDLSHYPDYNNAVDLDKKTIGAVLSGKSELFLEQLDKNKKEHVPNLATSMCGWTSVLTMLYMMEQSEGTSIHPIMYRNSADAGVYGDRDRVVGYQSLAVFNRNDNKTYDDFVLTEKDKTDLLHLAKKSIQYFLSTGEKFVPQESNYSSNLNETCGAFVSIYVKGELHGCIGRMNSEKDSLVCVIADMAVSSAFYDNRFPPLQEHEMDQLEIEISVLTPMHKISSISEIVLGQHGIYIKKGIHTGTFLPQVADNTDWGVEDFLGHCAKNKAGIGWDGWKDADIYTYEAIVFKNKK
jgi:AmmeMemoRadiSam system protein B/AmmeMemoRadiSam system protein A